MARRVTLNVSARAVAVAALERPHLDPGAARIVWRDRQRRLEQRAAAAPALIGVPAPGRLHSSGTGVVEPDADASYVARLSEYAVLSGAFKTLSVWH
jgi:hypothetical protein